MSRARSLAILIVSALVLMAVGTSYPEGVVVAVPQRDVQMWEQTLQPGDIIYSINGAKIAGLEQMRSLVAEAKTETVVLRVEHCGELLFIPMETK